jgi:hypothetical protein
VVHCPGQFVGRPGVTERVYPPEHPFAHDGSREYALRRRDPEYAPAREVDEMRPSEAAWELVCSRGKPSNAPPAD